MVFIKRLYCDRIHVGIGNCTDIGASKHHRELARSVMTRVSLLLLTLSLILSVNTAAGQNVNLTGKWAGTASFSGGTGGGAADVSASITQTATAITATLVITSGDVNGTFTGNGVI